MFVPVSPWNTLVGGCSYIMSAKNGGVQQTPPPSLSAKNQKSAYPPSHHCQKKIWNQLTPFPPLSEIIFCRTPNNQIKYTFKEES